MPLAAAPVLASIIGGGASLAGGALANRGSQTQTSSTTPTMDPAYAGLQGQVLKMIQDRLTGGSLPPGYESGGIQNINRSYDLVKQSQANDLTARGLGTSPIAGSVDATRDFRRAGDIGTFQTQLPLVQRQLQNQDLSAASGILGLGRGTTGTSTGTAEGGGGAAGAFGSLAQYLGYLINRGTFKGGGPAPTVAATSGDNGGLGWGY